MRTYSITTAKANLSRLVAKAAQGETFVIVKFGKPMVKVIALDPRELPQKKRFGFMTAQIKAPANFNRIGARIIQRLFEGKK